jgi:predicted O-methyltransferase YrrM
MNAELWTNVDDYINSVVISRDAALEAAAADALAAKLPPISVTPAYGKLLHLLAKMQDAQHVLEIGTLAGYSTIWLARAVPADGRVITIESNPMHADVARGNIARAGLSERVDIRVGAALDVLPQLAGEKLLPFDLTFIDADRTGLADYFDWAVRLSHRGSVIVVDNVVRKGAVVDAAASDNVDVQGIRRFNDRLKSDARVDATMIQTVSAKGYDGFAMALVR